MPKFTHTGTRKKEYVRQMFNDVSKRYDFLNKVLSFGIDSYWRKNLIRMMNIQKGISILDVATGTGDIVFEILKDNNVEITGLDYAENMIVEANEKAISKNVLNQVQFIHGDAEELPFSDCSFDLLSISFGFRNIGHYDVALSEFNRVLKPGGKLAILEFSEPNSKIFNIMYQFYFKHILPKVGAFISKSDGYKYLPESVKHFPSRAELKSMIKGSGFNNIIIKDLTFGVCSIFIGEKCDK